MNIKVYAAETTYAQIQGDPDADPTPIAAVLH